MSDYAAFVQILQKTMYFLCSDISELERIVEEVFMVYFKVLPRPLPGVTEGNNENLGQGSLCHSQHPNQALPEYKSESLPLESTCLAQYYRLYFFLYACPVLQQMKHRTESFVTVLQYSSHWGL
jgi:hypothetical protein